MCQMQVTENGNLSMLFVYNTFMADEGASRKLPKLVFP